MRTHTVRDIRCDLSLLERIEREGVTQAALAAEIGMSEGHLSRRLSRARRYRRRWEEEQESAHLLPHERDIDEPLVVLTDDPSIESNEFYNLDTDECSVDSGRVRIGDHDGRRLLIRSVNGGAPVEQPRESKRKSRAKPSRTKRLTPEEVEAIKAKFRPKRKRALIDT